MRGLKEANPFWIDGPVRHRRDFVGRSRDVRRVLGYLRNGQSVSIVGSSRCGKTSLLNHVADPGVFERYGVQADEHVFVRLDGRSFAGVDQSACFRGFHEEILVQFESFDAALGAQLMRATEDVSVMGHFGLRTLFRAVQESNLRPILQLDDFDDLAQNTCLEDNFFAALRSLAIGYEVIYMVASRRPLYELEEARPEASTLCGICQQLQLRCFTAEESRRLIIDCLHRAGVEFPAFAIDHILGLGSNEPYRVQLAGYHAFEVWRENGRELRKADCQEIERRLREMVEQ